MYTQIVGKLRLALSPMEPEWAHVTLYLTTRGLTTSPVPHPQGTFDAEFDFVDHQLVIRTTKGPSARVLLRGQAVADFYGEVMNALNSLGVSTSIMTMPQEVADPIPFPEDRTHATYVPDQATRFWRVLSSVDAVFKQHRARFRGRSSPVHFFWGSFDLAVTRFSGRPASAPEGAGRLARLAEDAEQICAGFWPGTAAFPEAAFFSYAFPKPEGIEQATLRPAGAGWDPSLGEFLLRYEDVRTADAPEPAIMDFLETSYQAGADGLQWSPELLVT
jgi:hypothetical protein